MYFKKIFYADTLVGKFQTDFGTIYQQPGNFKNIAFNEYVLSSVSTLTAVSQNLSPNCSVPDLFLKTTRPKLKLKLYSDRARLTL